MCFYDHIVFSCGDWKWGNFRKHCQKEYRIGEVCGMRLANNTFYEPEKCGICGNLEKKQRRYAKAKSDFERWRGDPARKASAAKAQEEMGVLISEMNKLEAERSAKYSNVGSNRPRVNGYH